MASLFFLCLILFVSLTYAQPSSVPPEIQQACESTPFPNACESSLTLSNRVPSNPTSLQLIQAAVWVTSQSLHTVQPMVKSILDSSTGNPNRSRDIDSCLDGLDHSDYRISKTINDALPPGRIKDARFWMSAVWQYHQSCLTSLKKFNDTKLVNDTVPHLDSLVGLTSNALRMVFSYDVYGKEIASWAPPKMERDGLWVAGAEGVGSGAGLRGGIPSNLTVDVTVCKDTSSGGCYKTVQEAVNATPDNAGDRRFVIHIKEGVYEEKVRVPLAKKNVVLLGDGMGKTVITGSLSVGVDGLTTTKTATVGVQGDGFMASGLTIQNTAGTDAGQAVAFRSDSDLSVIENCEFLGNQDTLYARALRQFYKSCRIEGKVDFIFGNAGAVFQDCQILIRPRQLKPEEGESNAITAHGRVDPAQASGFVFQNCSINGVKTRIFTKIL